MEVVLGQGKRIEAGAIGVLGYIAHLGQHPLRALEVAADGTKAFALGIRRRDRRQHE